MTRSNNRYEPLFDIHPVTGAIIKVFYADIRLVNFGRGGAGWFWQVRQRGFAPDGPARGPFATSYRAYRDALHPTPGSRQRAFFEFGLQRGCNGD